MVTNLMMSAEMVTLKVNIFWNKGYDAIIFVMTKILLRDSNYIVDVVMWPNFYERSYHNLNFIRIWPGKPNFLRGGLGSSSII